DESGAGVERRHTGASGSLRCGGERPRRLGDERAGVGGSVRLGLGAEWRRLSAVAGAGLRAGDEFPAGTFVGFVTDELEFARARDAGRQPALLRGRAGHESAAAVLPGGTG